MADIRSLAGVSSDCEHVGEILRISAGITNSCVVLSGLQGCHFLPQAWSRDRRPTQWRSRPRFNHAVAKLFSSRRDNLRLGGDRAPPARPEISERDPPLLPTTTALPRETAPTSETPLISTPRPGSPSCSCIAVSINIVPSTADRPSPLRMVDADVSHLPTRGKFTG